MTINKKDLAIIIVNRNRPDLTDALVEQLLPMGKDVAKDIYVIECGSDENKKSKYASFYYSDEDFRGKCYGHCKGLDYVLEKHGHYRFYWFLMNDLVFRTDPDPIDTMLEIIQSEPRMGILSPTEHDSNYASSRPQASRQWHKVSTCDYLALMMKDECLQEVGFLNPDFRYSWGAIHELSFKMYQADWFVAYCDRIVMKHLGGTTYGAAAKTIARKEYQQRAKQWAAKYFVDTYGQNWDKVFSGFLPEDIEANTYTSHRKYWEGTDRNSKGVWGKLQRKIGKALK